MELSTLSAGLAYVSLGGTQLRRITGVYGGSFQYDSYWRQPGGGWEVVAVDAFCTGTALESWAERPATAEELEQLDQAAQHRAAKEASGQLKAGLFRDCSDADLLAEVHRRGLGGR